MNKNSGLPRRRCMYEWDQFEVERHAAASLKGDTHRKSNRKLICRLVDGPASDVRHQREDEADMPAHSYAITCAILSCVILRLLSCLILCLRQRHSARDGRRQL